MTMIGPAEAAIKQAVLACLGSPVSQGRHTAAQVVAAIGIPSCRRTNGRS